MTVLGLLLYMTLTPFVYIYVKMYHTKNKKEISYEYKKYLTTREKNDHYFIRLEIL